MVNYMFKEKTTPSFDGLLLIILMERTHTLDPVQDCWVVNNPCVFVLLAGFPKLTYSFGFLCRGVCSLRRCVFVLIHNKVPFFCIVYATKFVPNLTLP